jgi:hypothetical protein
MNWIGLFSTVGPILQPKQEALDVQDRVGLWQIRWKIGTITLSRLYTRIDQVFLLWGLTTAIIFGIAQFCPISWVTQAVLWSGLSLVGVLGMAVLAWFWVTVERLRWVVYCWVGLMLAGVALTDLSIFLSWWRILLYLCPLWLGLSAIGYFCTGIGMRSRTFIGTGILHLLSIAALPYVGNWQFLATGAIMAGSLWFLSEVQWDMRPPIDFHLLTLEQKQFNQKQQQIRQLAVQSR